VWGINLVYMAPTAYTSTISRRRNAASTWWERVHRPVHHWQPHLAVFTTPRTGTYACHNVVLRWRACGHVPRPLHYRICRIVFLPSALNLCITVCSARHWRAGGWPLCLYVIIFSDIIMKYSGNYQMWLTMEEQRTEVLNYMFSNLEEKTPNLHQCWTTGLHKHHLKVTAKRS
jgi:hypothetical protein